MTQTTTTSQTVHMEEPGIREINGGFSYWAQTDSARTPEEQLEWLVNRGEEAQLKGFTWGVIFFHEDVPDLIGILCLPDEPQEEPQPRWKGQEGRS